MMKIIQVAPENIEKSNFVSYRNINYKVEDLEDHVRITFIVLADDKYKSNELAVNLYKDQHAGRINTIKVSNIDDKFSYVYYTTNFKRSSDGGTTPSNYELNVARVWMSENTEDIVVYLYFNVGNTPIYDEGIIDYQVVEKEVDQKTTFFKYCPEAYDIYKNWVVKSQIIGNPIDPSDSLSYLEEQVDILQDIVLQLVAKAGLDISNYQAILDKSSEYNVVKVKSAAKLMKELDNKARMRSAQKAYYRYQETGEF